MAYQEIQNKQNGEKGLSARTKINSMFQELYAAVGGFVSSLSNYFTKTELSESGAGGTVHWNNVTNKRVGKLSDTDGDTYIDVESTPDVDKIVAKSNQTGANVVYEQRDANNNLVYDLLANGTLRLYTNNILSNEIRGDFNGNGKGLIFNSKDSNSGHFGFHLFQINGVNVGIIGAATDPMKVILGESVSYNLGGQRPARVNIAGSIPLLLHNNGNFEIRFANSYGSNIPSANIRFRIIDAIETNGYKSKLQIGTNIDDSPNSVAYTVTFYNGKIGINKDSPNEAIDLVGNFKIDGKIKAVSLPLYIDNADAIAGGLVAGDVYRTSTGELRITI